MKSAEAGTRTRTPFRAADFKSAASADSATPAWCPVSESTGLRAGEGRGVADFGRRDLDRAGLQLVVDHRGQGEPESGIIAGEALDQIILPAARGQIAPVVELARFIAASQAGDVADIVDRRRSRPAAAQLASPDDACLGGDVDRAAHGDAPP